MAIRRRFTDPLVDAAVRQFDAEIRHITERIASAGQMHTSLHDREAAAARVRREQLDERAVRMTDRADRIAAGFDMRLCELEGEARLRNSRLVWFALAFALVAMTLAVSLLLILSGQ